VSKVIVDTGPLVAFLVQTDLHHKWAVEQFHALQAPLLTCEPVLTETFFLISRLRGGTIKYFELLATGVVIVEFDLLAEHEALRKLVAKYADLPMSLADACLVRMTELIGEATVLTLDYHFRTYRRNGRQMIPLLVPD
jgi:uncharacterized protein